MIYVTADIHGEYDRFHQMLNGISFSSNDELYILGDVIDRGVGGVDLLLEIIDQPNMHMLIGNHEDMMLEVLGPNSYPDSRQMWAQNGGNKTRRELLYHRTSAERHKILSFCRKLPDSCAVTVGYRTFHLVHGYPSDKYLDKIWGRVTPDSHFNGMYIVGHTPTCYLTGKFKEPYQIYYGDGFICIDCGCGNMTNPYRRLACLRLDDMKEFYF